MDGEPVSLMPTQALEDERMAEAYQRLADRSPTAQQIHLAKTRLDPDHILAMRPYRTASTSCLGLLWQKSIFPTVSDP